MSTLTNPPPAKLFFSILFRGDATPKDSPELSEVLSTLTQNFGPIDVLSPILPFNYTKYYCAEMGQHIWRRVLSFERLVAREQLVDVKHQCIEWERHYMDAVGKRALNLDPGLVSRENLILATGKNNPHRVFLGRGVFADLTLIYQHKTFAPLPWTYPDYASPELTALLIEMRQRLLAALKPHESPAG